jgi:hypothetical protein
MSVRGTRAWAGANQDRLEGALIGKPARVAAPPARPSSRPTPPSRYVRIARLGNGSGKRRDRGRPGGREEQRAAERRVAALINEAAGGRRASGVGGADARGGDRAVAGPDALPRPERRHRRRAHRPRARPLWLLATFGLVVYTGGAVLLAIVGAPVRVTAVGGAVGDRRHSCVARLRTARPRERLVDAHSKGRRGSCRNM